MSNRSITREEAFSIINTERDYQVDIWYDDETTSIGDFTLYMEEYLSKARKSLTEAEDTDGLVEIRKVVALGIACIEKFGCPPRVLADDYDPAVYYDEEPKTLSIPPNPIGNSDGSVTFKGPISIGTSLATIKDPIKDYTDDIQKKIEERKTLAKIFRNELFNQLGISELQLHNDLDANHYEKPKQVNPYDKLRDVCTLGYTYKLLSNVDGSVMSSQDHNQVKGTLIMGELMGMDPVVVGEYIVRESSDGFRMTLNSLL